MEWLRSRHQEVDAQEVELDDEVAGRATEGGDSGLLLAE